MRELKIFYTSYIKRQPGIDEDFSTVIMCTCEIDKKQVYDKI